jgi:hypothetical protein
MPEKYHEIPLARPMLDWHKTIVIAPCGAAVMG